MNAAGLTAELQSAIALVSHEQDGQDIVVCAPVDDRDRRADGARAAALGYVACKLQNDFGTVKFVIERRQLADEDERDRRTINDLRRAGRLVRETQVIHSRPSNELLLGMPDVLAWSFRQEYQRKNPFWFAPFKAGTHVTQLPRASPDATIRSTASREARPRA
ncbi:hypothetical protein [Subtercola boreus]|uniref:hypothetical protein n=1 Tax=Subtercola boreus TaxID=120213 RepID=UPI001152652E|nr:hypothetical protein [Subtercola boreus]